MKLPIQGPLIWSLHFLEGVKPKLSLNSTQRPPSNHYLQTQQEQALTPSLLPVALETSLSRESTEQSGFRS